MKEIIEFATEQAKRYKALATSTTAIKLIGSRSAGYHTPMSDYDFAILCNEETYQQFAESLAKDPHTHGLTLDTKNHRVPREAKIDITVHKWTDIENAMHSYYDIMLWIWSNAKPVVDPEDRIKELQRGFSEYPREVLSINPRQLQRYVHGDTSLEKNPGRPAVVTEEIKEYVKAEYAIICSEGPRRWRKQVSEAVAEKFHVTLKSSTLSALVAELSGNSSSCKADGARDSRVEQASVEAEKEESAEEEILLEQPQAESELSDLQIQQTLAPWQLPEDPTEFPEVLRRPGSIDPEESGFDGQERLEERLREEIYSRYAGGLLLNPLIARMLEGVLKEERPAYSVTQISFQSYLLTLLQMNTFECNNYEFFARASYG